MTARRTSIKAYHDINANGLLKGRRLVVYNWLYFNGPATGAQVVLGVTDPDRRVISQDRARLNELRAMGCVCEVGTIVCSETRKEVILWDVTDNYPEALPKKIKRLTRSELEQKNSFLSHRIKVLESLVSKLYRKLKDRVNVNESERESENEDQDIISTELHGVSTEG